MDALSRDKERFQLFGIPPAELAERDGDATESWAHGSSNFGTNLPIVDHSLIESWSRLRLCSGSPKPLVR